MGFQSVCLKPSFTCWYLPDCTHYSSKVSGGTWESGPKDPTEEGTSFIIFCQLECIPIGPRESLNYPPNSRSTYGFRFHRGRSIIAKRFWCGLLSCEAMVTCEFLVLGAVWRKKRHILCREGNFRSWILSLERGCEYSLLPPCASCLTGSLCHLT